jgi:V8-like Glu-specific endopeptidase
MITKRVSLPYPPEVQTEVPTGLEMAGAQDPQELITAFVQQQKSLEHQAELLEAKVSRMAFESICGAADESQGVELYDGSLGVSVEFVRSFSPPVGQLQWLDNLNSLFQGSGNSPGNVNGVRWGSGSLIGSDLFITAGHCFDRAGGGWERPKRNGVTIAAAEIATLMKVNFNFQVDAQTNQLRQEDSYPVVLLHEFRLGNLDYAIVQLGKNANGEIPGDKFGRLGVAGSDLITNGATLCVIQHPNGRPKMIEAGPLLSNMNGQISYDSIDTLGGSSGSAVLNGETGEVVGIHTNGGCAAFSGANFGVAIGAIRKFSSIL